MQVRNDYDVDYDFSKLKNYAWQALEIKNPLMHNALVEERVHEAVDYELMQKEFKETDLEKVDFFVAYHYLARDLTDAEKKQINSAFAPGNPTGYDNVFENVGFGIPVAIRADQQIETLAIDIIDANSKKLIWRGYGNQKLLDSGPKKTMANFAKAARAILKNFPPSGGK